MSFLLIIEDNSFATNTAAPVIPVSGIHSQELDLGRLFFHTEAFTTAAGIIHVGILKPE